MQRTSTFAPIHCLGSGVLAALPAAILAKFDRLSAKAQRKQESVYAMTWLKNLVANAFT